MNKKLSISLFLSGLLLCQSAFANNLIYQGSNPNITPGASPYNATNIDTRAALTRPKEKTSDTNAGKSDAELVKQSVLSSLSSTITQKLTGTTVGNGTVNFGDGSWAEFTTVNNIRTITTHNLDGTSTTISFPL